MSVVLFNGFELLDVFGPLEVLSMVPERFTVSLVGPSVGPVTSSQGAAVLANQSQSQAAAPDIVLVPGGAGTRQLVRDTQWLRWLREWASQASLITSVCTGAALLAAAGLLNGYRATTNNHHFAWVSAFGADTAWQPGARWVHDRDRWTSAGISAGIDMTLALVGELCGSGVAENVAARMEYDWPGLPPINH